MLVELAKIETESFRQQRKAIEVGQTLAALDLADVFRGYITGARYISLAKVEFATATAQDISEGLVVHRDQCGAAGVSIKHPVLAPDPRSFSRNKRGIAGTLIWINFDRHALLNIVRLNAGQFVANVDDIRSQYSPASSAYIGQTAVFSSSLISDSGLPLGADISQIDATQQLTAVSVT